MATFPTTITPSNVRSIRRSSSRLAMSPFNYTQQVHDFKGKLKVVEFTYPPLTQTQAEDMDEFLDSCDGVTNTFSVDLSDYFPGTTQTNVNMRLADPDYQFDISTAMTYGFSFIAIEAR